MLDTTEKPGVEEVYQTAGNTSDLTVEADRRGAGDVLIAAGWSESRIGMALLRLHSEWDGCAKPKRADHRAVERLVEIIKQDDEKTRLSAQFRGAPYEHPKESAVVRANKAAEHWFANELRLLSTGLKSRPQVWAQLLPWVTLKGISPDDAAEALLYWLDPTCRRCDGHGLLKVAGQPALGARRCGKCDTGKKYQPKGAGKLLAHLDYCVSVARGSLKKRLRPQ